ncbi:hypothetical protein [Streptomyces sp. NPDC050504]|uniref:hypothetical protein n=1 Tax=Streptomyces sp. NPDC050504 TaxID=3365618 RepID=UPI0037ACA860
MEVEPVDAGLHHPDYPPRTPPPPKRPVAPQRPEPDTTPTPKKTALALRRPAAVISNRRAASWVLENAPWSPKKAARHVVDQLATWGHTGTTSQQDTCTAVTRELALAALSDGGKKITVHVADQDDTALVLVLSHQDGPAPAPAPDLLTRLHALGALSCGTETERDEPGNRRWALLDLAH